MGNIEAVDPWVIRKSLEKSHVRAKLFKHLCEKHPEGVSLADLCKAVGSNKPNVMGALMGYSSRYNEECSLVSMGLATHAVLLVDKHPVQVFTITQHGLHVYNALKDEESSSSILLRSRIPIDSRDII